MVFSPVQRLRGSSREWLIPTGLKALKVAPYTIWNPIGECSALATVTWKNLRDDGSVARQWRQSYNVVRLADGDDISPQRCGGAVTLACGTFLTCGRVLTMSVHKGKADFRVRALCGPEMTQAV